MNKFDLLKLPDFEISIPNPAPSIGSLPKGQSFDAVVFREAGHDRPVLNWMDQWSQLARGWNDALKQEEQRRAERVQANLPRVEGWTREQWDAEFIRVVQQLQESWKTPKDYETTNAAAEEFQLFRDLAKHHGFVITIDTDEPAVANDPTDVTFTGVFTETITPKKD